MPTPGQPLPKLILRHQLDVTAWDACLSAAAHPLLYAYSWYLDAILPAPDWTWAGIVLMDEAGQYRAVMPVPLRRKTVLGMPYGWVVHQPFFCQFLGIFSRDILLDPTPFFQLLVDHFRYCSRLCTRQQPDTGLPVDSGQAVTHCLDLSVGYPAIYQNYTSDRKTNLRRAMAANWTIMPSTDPDPLLTLFRANHANTIEGGVADWAYTIFRNVLNELSIRSLVTLRYAWNEGQIEAGVLFVEQGDRIIYLFNAASKTGRTGNARTLMLDQLIREKAGQSLILDFESPAKSSIRHFYQSFGASEELYWTVQWNHLNPVERALLRSKKLFDRLI